MKRVNVDELKNNADILLHKALKNNELFEVETDDGIAVVVNKREWDILLDMFIKRQ